MSLQNQQLLPALTFRDDELKDPTKAAKLIRDLHATVGVAFERAMRLVDTDPRMSDARVAHALQTMQGDVSLDRATLPSPGDLFYAIDGGRYGVFGTAASGAPTGGGTVPAAGSYNALLDGNYHTDTTATAVTLGMLPYGNVTPKWTGLPGNITTTRKFLRQTGTGAVSAVPVWDTLVAGDIPALSAAGGWTDDGTVVRLTTSTDQVGIGTASPGASLGIVNVNATADVVLKVTGKLAQTGKMVGLFNSVGQPLANLNATGSLFLGNINATTTPVILALGADVNVGGQFFPDNCIVTWGDNNSALSPPSNTADMIGPKGARFYTYKDSTGVYDSGYGQDGADAWVLVSDETITYSIFTGVMGGTAFLRGQWDGNGDYRNYGLVHVKKSTGAVTKGVPQLRLEETGAGTNYTGFKAPAAITTDHTYTLPSGVPSVSSLWTVSSAGVLAAVSIPTRRVWIDAEAWTGFNGSVVGGTGAPPDVYGAHLLIDGSDTNNLGTTVEVPDNWLSGVITVKCHWTTSAAAAQNWVPHFYYLERVDGDSMVAAGTHITGPTTSANFAANILKITTVGTFTPGAAGRLLRLVVNRLAVSDANDTYTDDINFIGVELSFVPSY